MNIQKQDRAYMNQAIEWAKNSDCTILKVGAIIVKNEHIISEGFNGTPRNRDNCCEECGKTKPEVIHAEANAICKLARNSGGGFGSTLYTTHSPCMECAKLILQAGMIRVVYLNEYKNLIGVDLLRDSGVQVDTYTIK